MEKYTPIAVKDLGIDTESGMPKKVYFHKQISDAKNGTVEVFWDVVLLSPTDTVVGIVQSGSYWRTDAKFEALRESPLGQGIAKLIQGEADTIQSEETINEDLRQK